MANIDDAPRPLDELHRRGPARIHLHGTEVALGRDEVDAPDADETRTPRQLRRPSATAVDQCPAGRSIRMLPQYRNPDDTEGALTDQLPRDTERDTTTCLPRRTRQSRIRLRRTPAGSGRASPFSSGCHSLTPCPPPDTRGLISHRSTSLASRHLPGSDVMTRGARMLAVVRRPRQALRISHLPQDLGCDCPTAHARPPARRRPVDDSRGSRDRRPHHSVARVPRSRPPRAKRSIRSLVATTAPAPTDADRGRRTRRARSPRSQLALPIPPPRAWTRPTIRTRTSSLDSKSSASGLREITYRWSRTVPRRVADAKRLDERRGTSTSQAVSQERGALRGMLGNCGKAGEHLDGSSGQRRATIASSVLHGSPQLAPAVPTTPRRGPMAPTPPASPPPSRGSRDSPRAPSDARASSLPPAPRRAPSGAPRHAQGTSGKDHLLGDLTSEERDFSVERSARHRAERPRRTTETVHDASLFDGDGGSERPSELEENERHLSLRDSYVAAPARESQARRRRPCPRCPCPRG